MIQSKLGSTESLLGLNLAAGHETIPSDVVFVKNKINMSQSNALNFDKHISIEHTLGVN